MSVGLRSCKDMREYQTFFTLVTHIFVFMRRDLSSVSQIKYVIINIEEKRKRKGITS